MWHFTIGRGVLFVGPIQINTKVFSYNRDSSERKYKVLQTDQYKLDAMTESTNSRNYRVLQTKLVEKNMHLNLRIVEIIESFRRYEGLAGGFHLRIVEIIESFRRHTGSERRRRSTNSRNYRVLQTTSHLSGVRELSTNSRNYRVLQTICRRYHAPRIYE